MPSKDIYLLSIYNYDRLDKRRIIACIHHVISNSVLKYFSRVVRPSTPGLAFGVSELYDDSSSKVGEMRGLAFVVYCMCVICQSPLFSMVTNELSLAHLSRPMYEIK